MFIRKEAAKANDANAIFIRKQKEIKEKEERIGKLKADLDEIKRTMSIAANDEAMSNLIIHANTTQRMISELQDKNDIDIANMQMFEQDMLKAREEIRKRIEEKQAEIEKAKQDKKQ
jgi:hypothetical protein